MKKSLLKFLPLAVAVMLATSCSKDENNNSENTPETTEVVNKKGIVQIPFSVGIANAKSLSKVAFSENGATINFESDDVETVKLTVTGEGVSGDLNLVNENGYKFSGTLGVEADKEAAFKETGIDLQGTFTQNKGDQTSNTNFEELLNNCAHTYNTTFKSTAENLTLIDQNFYVYVERAKDGIKIGEQTSFEQGTYYVFPIGTTVDGKTVEAAKLYTIGKAVSSVTLDKTTVSVNVNATETLTATVTPSDATNTSVVWTSSDETIATVDANGVVTGIKGGTATITATSDGQSATCEVTVVQKVTSISISGGFSSSSNNPYVWGSETTDNKTLTATVLPDDATNKTLEWTSSNPSIVTVDENGKITIIAPNTETSTKTITITATAKDGSGESATYTLYLANYVQLAGAKWYTYDSQTSVNWSNRANGAPSGSAVPTKSQLEALINTNNVNISGNNIISKNGSNAYITLTYGDYWSGEDDGTNYPDCLHFNSDNPRVGYKVKNQTCRVRLVRAQ